MQRDSVARGAVPACLVPVDTTSSTSATTTVSGSSTSSTSGEAVRLSRRTVEPLALELQPQERLDLTASNALRDIDNAPYRELGDFTGGS